MDVVVADAVGDRLPGADALRETLRRRRASGGPAEQTFATLVGLELRPRRLRAASNLWAMVGERHGIKARDGIWAHPDLVPTGRGPGRADRLRPSGSARRPPRWDDPMAELERTEREKKAREESGEQPDGGEQAG